MYSVLIADDESIIRKGLKSFVKKHGEFDVVAMAEDGQEALALSEELHPDVCLVDINMPFMNGLDFIERLTKISPDSICVVITGYDDFSYVQRALRMHVKDYLLKPVNEDDFNKLMSDIKEVLETRVKTNEIKTWQDYNYDKLKNIDSGDNSYSEKIKDARQYIKEHFSEPDLSLGETADHIHVSSPYLSKKFKEETGDSFGEYLQRLRLSKALSLLADGDSPIYEIAYKCGYSSQHYFSTAFKKELNISPADYRKNVQKKEKI